MPVTPSPALAGRESERLIPEKRVKMKIPCPEKPELLLGQPIGMYHWPCCGQMQVAGLPHLPDQAVEGSMEVPLVEESDLTVIFLPTTQVKYEKKEE